MATLREPHIHQIAIKDLRPTQITVGMREVAAKRQHWRTSKEEKQETYLGNHMVPVVQGAKERYFLVDHHHLVLALLHEGQDTVAISVIADLSRLDTDEFFTFLDNRGWMHPFDENGKRQSYRSLPKTVEKLIDDPYRSLAGELRRMGGYAKDETPFSEFIWADYLRRRIKRKLVDDNYGVAMEKALLLAKNADADIMPGWCGPVQGDG